MEFTWQTKSSVVYFHVSQYIHIAKVKVRLARWGNSILCYQGTLEDYVKTSGAWVIVNVHCELISGFCGNLFHCNILTLEFNRNQLESLIYTKKAM